MIKLRKTAEPPLLVRSAADWTAELKKALVAGQDPTRAQQQRYRHPEIKAALISETHGKCAYCEVKALVSGSGDIRHIIPKILRPELRFAWANLTLACDVCNTKKGANENIIDPYTDDPQEHFRFYGPMIAVRPGSELGKRSLAILDLNRTALLEHRKEKLDEFVRRAHEICYTADESTRLILLKALLDDARSATKEFSGCTQALIIDMQADGSLPAE